MCRAEEGNDNASPPQPTRCTPSCLLHVCTPPHTHMNKKGRTLVGGGGLSAAPPPFAATAMAGSVGLSGGRRPLSRRALLPLPRRGRGVGANTTADHRGAPVRVVGRGTGRMMALFLFFFLLSSRRTRNTHKRGASLASLTLLLSQPIRIFSDSPQSPSAHILFLPLPLPVLAPTRKRPRQLDDRSILHGHEGVRRPGLVRGGWTGACSRGGGALLGGKRRGVFLRARPLHAFPAVKDRELSARRPPNARVVSDEHELESHRGGGAAVHGVAGPGCGRWELSAHWFSRSRSRAF